MKRLSPLVGVCLLFPAACAPAHKGPPDALATPSYIRAVAMLQYDARSDDPVVRANCIEALESARDPRALNVIEAGLHDNIWLVRFAAAMAAGKRKAVTVKPVLLPMSVSDESMSVRAASIFALHRMGNDANMSDLAGLLTLPDATIRANVCMVFGELGIASAIPLLQSRRDEQDIRVRYELTRALARLGDDEAQKIIASWAVNKFAEDQLNAMEACGDLPLTVAQTPLIAGLQDLPPMAPTVSEADREAARDLTTQRQLIAARSLAKLNDSEGATIAINNLKNPNPNLRALAVLALGEMMAPEKTAALEPFLSDKDAGVRRATAAAIVNIFVRSEAAEEIH